MWPYLGHGAGPEHVGFVQAITSKFNTYKSLKKSIPFHPPNNSRFIPLTKVHEWPYLALGDPLPSGP
jgi:hypothetical protein